MGRFDNIPSGAEYPLKNNLDAAAEPIATDDANAGYEPGSMWVDITNKKAYQCVDSSIGAAIWQTLSPTGSSKSAVVSFASGSSKHVSTTSPTYESLAHIIFAGTDIVGTILSVNINAWRSGGGGGAFMDIRIVNLSNADVICELTGITSIDEFNVQNMGTLSNIPATATVFEIQGTRSAGATGYIASLEISY
jgi:hypothetical protein